jgi:hypothetical protein
MAVLRVLRIRARPPPAAPKTVDDCSTSLLCAIQGGPVVSEHTTGLAPVDALTDGLDRHRYQPIATTGLVPVGR